MMAETNQPEKPKSPSTDPTNTTNPEKIMPITEVCHSDDESNNNAVIKNASKNETTTPENNDNNNNNNPIINNKVESSTSIANKKSNSNETHETNNNALSNDHSQQDSSTYTDNTLRSQITTSSGNHFHTQSQSMSHRVLTATNDINFDHTQKWHQNHSSFSHHPRNSNDDHHNISNLHHTNLFHKSSLGHQDSINSLYGTQHTHGSNFSNELNNARISISNKNSKDNTHQSNNQQTTNKGILEAKNSIASTGRDPNSKNNSVKKLLGNTSRNSLCRTDSNAANNLINIHSHIAELAASANDNNNNNNNSLKSNNKPENANAKLALEEKVSNLSNQINVNKIETDNNNNNNPENAMSKIPVENKISSCDPNKVNLTITNKNLANAQNLSQLVKNLKANLSANSVNSLAGSIEPPTLESPSDGTPGAGGSGTATKITSNNTNIINQEEEEIDDANNEHHNLDRQGTLKKPLEQAASQPDKDKNHIVTGVPFKKGGIDYEAIYGNFGMRSKNSIRIKKESGEGEKKEKEDDEDENLVDQKQVTSGNKNDKTGNLFNSDNSNESPSEGTNMINGNLNNHNSNKNNQNNNNNGRRHSTFTKMNKNQFNGYQNQTPHNMAPWAIGQRGIPMVIPTYHYSDLQMHSQKTTVDNNSSTVNNMNDKKVVKFLIPAKAAGAIIGKGGSNIKNLREFFQAHITIPDAPTPERVIKIQMTEIKTIINVCKKITELLKEDIQKLRRSRQHKAHKKPDPNESEITEMKLLVHESQAGAIIGPKGSHVKKINEKTGAKINVHTEICPKSTEKVVQVTGKIEAVTNAIGEILVLFNDFPPKGNIFPYDPNNFDPSYDYGGYGFSPNTMQNINNNGNNNNNNLVHNNNNTNNNRINLNQNGNLINNHSHSIQNLSNAHSPLKSFQGLTITANSTNKSNLNLMNMHAATPVTTPLSINTNTNHSNHNFGGSAKNNNNFSNLRRGTAPDIMNGISSLASGFQKMAPFRANNHHHNNHNNNNTNFLQNHLPNNNNLGIPLALQPGAMLPGHPQGFPTGPAGIPGLPVGFINPSALGGQQSNHPNTTAGQPPSMDPHSYSSYNSMGGFSRDNDNNGHHHHHHHNNNNNTSKSKDSGENHTNANNLSKLSDNSFTEGDSHMANGNSNKNRSSDSNNNNNNNINQLANTNNNTNLNNVNLNNKPSAFPAVPGYPYNSPFFPPAYFMYNGQLIPGPGHPDNIGNPLANNFAAGAGAAAAAAAGPQFTTSMTMANPQGYMPPNTGFNPFATNQSNQNNNNNNNHLHQQGQSPQLGHSILDRKNTADS